MLVPLISRAEPGKLASGESTASRVRLACQVATRHAVPPLVYAGVAVPSSCVQFRPPCGSERGHAMPAQQRPLRELCTELRIVDVVRAGLPDWEVLGIGLAKILRPEDRGIRIIGRQTPSFVEITARMCRARGLMGRGTLQIGEPFIGYIW